MVSVKSRRLCFTHCTRLADSLFQSPPIFSQWMFSLVPNQLRHAWWFDRYKGFRYRSTVDRFLALSIGKKGVVGTAVLAMLCYAMLEVWFWGRPDASSICSRWVVTDWAIKRIARALIQTLIVWRALHGSIQTRVMLIIIRFRVRSYLFIHLNTAVL